jgi:enoyl-CoA hydratase/carnithine racemase
MATQDSLYNGPDGYVTLSSVDHNGQRGVMLRYVNPDLRKLHAIDATGISELLHAIAIVEEQLTAGRDVAPEFLILHGAYDPLHAGADVTQFDGDPDYDAIRDLLYSGIELDARIKRLWSRLRTVAAFSGNRFGGSVEWPLFAQFAVCDSATVIQLSEVQLGILPGWNGILNVMLKSNASNAQYMASTGNPADAQQMLAANFVQSVVDAPAAPDRKLLGDTEYAVAWQAFAAGAQGQLLRAAMDLATSNVEATLGTEFQLCDAEEYLAEIGRRTQDTEYRDLRASIEAQLKALGPDASPDEIKALSKMVNAELGLLGKPLAPEAVNFVQRYVKQFGALKPEEILSRFDELGKIEADLCVELMHHAHRREGVRAVLSKSPAERIPVFAEVDYSDEIVSPYEFSDGSG